MIKKFATLCVAVMAITTAAAQAVNQKDAQGNRQGIWKGTYDGGNPRYEGTFDHGRETGTFTFFDDSKAHTVAATRVFAKDGSCYTTFFEPTGTKVSEGKEINKLREGEWVYYHFKAKSIMAKETYKQGKIEGVRRVFFPSGEIAEETSYINGIKDGPYRKFTEKALVLEEATYKNDKYEGPAIYRDSKGNIVSQGVYKAGLKTGVWKFLENGKLKEKNMDIKVRDAELKAAKEKAKN
jgi:antitoxin component YwqK of YwqJK toxin-antitoxin module